MSNSLPWAIVWLRHSLRLHDNPMIERCIQEGYRPSGLHYAYTRIRNRSLGDLLH